MARKFGDEFDSATIDAVLDEAHGDSVRAERRLRQMRPRSASLAEREAQRLAARDEREASEAMQRAQASDDVRRLLALTHSLEPRRERSRSYFERSPAVERRRPADAPDYVATSRGPDSVATSSGPDSVATSRGPDSVATSSERIAALPLRSGDGELRTPVRGADRPDRVPLVVARAPEPEPPRSAATSSTASLQYSKAGRGLRNAIGENNVSAI